MRKTPLLLLLLLACIALRTAAALPDKASVLEAMQRANAYFVAKWPDPATPIVTDKTRPSNIWTRGTYYEGALALHRINRSAAIHDYAVAWGTAHAWNLSGGTATRNADNQCCGQTYLELYQIDPQPARIANIRTSILAMVNSTKRDDWWWIDALHMAMPVFARLGVVENDPRYFEAMYQLFNDTRTVRGLYNTTEHLWWRDNAFKPPFKTPGGQNCYWSRGNGWVFAAMVRTLDILPANTPHRDDYLAIFLEMAAALRPLQRSDGFWNPSLADPNDFGGKETSGTAMFTYGMAWGIRQGLLPANEYLPVVTKAWNAMVADALHPDGALGYVQGTGAQPSDSQPVTYDKMPNFEDFGLGCFLLAGAEMYRLVEQPPTTANVTLGHTLNLSAPTGATALACQWQLSTDGGRTWANLTNNTTYSGVTTATLTIANAASSLNGYKYRCVVTTATGPLTGTSTTLAVAPALLANPLGLALDTSGNLYVSDGTNNTIQKIALTNGTATVFAGSINTLGSTDGTGTAALFRAPAGLALDSAGNLYVADTGNSTIRKITSAGVVSTLAGSATNSGTANGSGSAARFSSPADLCVNSSGTLYVADTGNHIIRQVSSAGAVTTLAGSAGNPGTADGIATAARFNAPTGIAINAAGASLYIADTTNNTLRTATTIAGVNPAGVVTTLAGTYGVSGTTDGTGTAALFSGPTGTTTDSAGNLFVADTQNSTIRKITTTGTVTTVAGLPGVAGLKDGTGTDAWFNKPRDVALDASGQLYVADTGNAAIRKIDLTTGAVTTLVLTAAASSSSGSSSSGASSSSSSSSSSGSSSGGGGGALGYSYFAVLGLLYTLRQVMRKR
jgi:rhamnogalacturonyl hydrolase YesR/sugar lactone lactonase YvrE